MNNRWSHRQDSARRNHAIDRRYLCRELMDFIVGQDAQPMCGGEHAERTVLRCRIIRGGLAKP